MLQKIKNFNKIALTNLNKEIKFFLLQRTNKHLNVDQKILRQLNMISILTLYLNNIGK